MELKLGELNTKQVREAEAVNLELLSRTTNPNYNYYRFLSCGHEDFLQPTHVRRNHIRCEKCKNIRVADKITELGFVLLHKNTENNFLTLQVKNCGHTLTISELNLLRRSTNNNFCTECYTLKLQKEATDHNLTYLGLSNKGGLFRKYKFNDCGHEKDINATTIPRGAFECKECKKKSHIDKCLTFGLTLDGKSSDISGRHNNYRLPCGHKRIIRADHAEEGSYTCLVCQDSFYTKESNIYLLKMTCKNDYFSWLKLGFSRNLDVRRSNYGLGNDVVVEVLKKLKIESGELALKYEKAIHKKLKVKRISFETMKKYHKRNGYTECYPVDCEQSILADLEQIKGDSCG